MKQNKEKIGIVGYGNMGSAIAQKIRFVFKTVIFDKDTTKTKNIPTVITASNLSELVNIADVIILAVKPQDFSEVLDEIKNNIDGKLVISIAAGRPTKAIEKILGKVRVIRVMPNLPAKIGKGMSCLSRGKFASRADLHLAKKIFDFIGDTLVLNENMMDAATADSGSGPGFICQLVSGKSLKEAKKIARIELMPLMLDAGMDIGFKRGQAKLLAVATTAGTMALLEKSNISAENLVKQVASKGGTTEAGLKVLKGNKKFLSKAFKAALKRAKELSKK